MAIIKRSGQRRGHAYGQGAAHAMGTDAEPHLSQPPAQIEALMADDMDADRRRNDERRRQFRRVEDKELISGAQQEANAIRERAQIQGFEAGLGEAEQSLEQLGQLFERLLEGRGDALASAADTIGALAVEIAERLIKAQVAADESLVKGLVSDTLTQVDRDTKNVIIKAHPSDVSILAESLEAMRPKNLQADLLVMEDETVSPGSCVVETNSGLIDASFSTQLAILKRLLGISGGG